VRGPGSSDFSCVVIIVRERWPSIRIQRWHHRRSKTLLYVVRIVVDVVGLQIVGLDLSDSSQRRTQVGTIVPGDGVFVPTVGLEPCVRCVLDKRRNLIGGTDTILFPGRMSLCQLTKILIFFGLDPVCNANGESEACN
jgi:hypothetical protein